MWRPGACPERSGSGPSRAHGSRGKRASPGSWGGRWGGVRSCLVSGARGDCGHGLHVIRGGAPTSGDRPPEQGEAGWVS